MICENVLSFSGGDQVYCPAQATVRFRWLAQDQSVIREKIVCGDHSEELLGAYAIEIEEGAVLIGDIEEGE